MLKTKVVIAILVVLSVVTAGSWTVSGSGGQGPATSSPSDKPVLAPVETAAFKATARGHAYRTLSLSVARRGHSATAVDGRVLVVGGENSDGAVAEVEIIDPLSQTSRIIAKLGEARTDHTATTLADGRILIIGGSKGPNALASTEVFDPQTESLSAGPRLTRPRSGHTATLLADGRVLVAGGRKDQSAELLDPKTGRFALLSSQTLDRRVNHSAALLANGSVLIVGGQDAADKPVDTAELFNPATSRFEEISGWMMSERVRPVINQLADGKVQIIGGDDAGSMEMYDPEQRIFRSSAQLPLTAGILPTKTILLAQTRSAYLDNAHARSEKNKKTGALEAQSAANQTPLDVKGYSLTEIPGSSQVVVAGGVDGRGQIVSSVLVTEGSGRAAVTTDSIEYGPEASPKISGSGWQPGEGILIVRQQLAGEKSRMTLQATADANGDFASGELTPADHKVSAYILTAIGEQSGCVAQTTYRSAPPLDPKNAGRKPVKFKVNVPVDGKPGSVDTPIGPFTWGPRGGSNEPASSFAPQSSESVDEGGFGDISVAGCLSPGFVSLCGEATLNVIRSHFSMKMELAIGIKAGFDPLPFFEASATFDQSLDAGITFRLSGSGRIIAEGIVLPFFPSIQFGAGPLNGTLGCGLLLGASLEIDPTTLEFDLNVKDALKVGARFSLDSGFTPIDEVATAEATGDVRVIEFGTVTLRVYTGPAIQLGLSFGFGEGSELGSAEASADARAIGFVEGSILPEFSDTCEKFTVTISAGIEASLGASAFVSFGELDVFDIGGGFGGELFRLNIASFTHTLKDEEPPVITASDATISTAPGQCSQNVEYTLDASDSCSGLASVICSPPSGSTFSKGVTPVTCTATDNVNNTQSASFNVTVVDNEPPSFIPAPGNITLPNDPGRCSAKFTPTATDNCPGGVTLSCNPPSGSTLPKGVTTVNCTATDASQNTASASFTVKVEDTERPTVSGDLDLHASIPPGTFRGRVPFAAPVTDNCPGMQVELAPPSGSTLPVGTTMVTGIATDAVGNVTVFHFRVHVYNIVVVDESTGALFRAIWNGGSTAQYEYFDCRKGVHFAGTMSVTRNSCKVEGRDTGPDPKQPDRNVYILLNLCTFNASVQIQVGDTTNSFNDADVRDSRPSCP